MDVLLEIKRDPMYRKPRPVLVNPNSPYADQYCAFHNTTGHRTEAYISLRILIERFIENGKLVRYLANQMILPNPGHGNHPGKITISSTRIKTILGMTEKEIGKELGNQSADQILGLPEKEVEAEPDQHHRKTSRKYTPFLGVSEEEESPARLGRRMRGN